MVATYSSPPRLWHPLPVAVRLGCWRHLRERSLLCLFGTTPRGWLAPQGFATTPTSGQPLSARAYHTLRSEQRTGCLATCWLSSCHRNVSGITATVHPHAAPRWATVYHYAWLPLRPVEGTTAGGRYTRSFLHRIGISRYLYSLPASHY